VIEWIEFKRKMRA